MTSGNRDIIQVSDAEALAENAAHRLVARIEARPNPAICLTGGSSPQRLYQLLAEEPY